MKTNLYVITDTKANRTTEPFSCPTDAVAKRNFIFGCLASETPPQDSILWRIASFFTDEEDSTCFGFSDVMQQSGAKVVNITIEEIEAYAKVYNMIHLSDSTDDDFEKFSERGVIE